jgi:hypothetical protein
MKTRMMLAAVFIGTIPMSASSDDVSELMQGPKMRFPNRFHYELTKGIGEPFFKCDDATKTCMKGFASEGTRFVGVVLADDRKTILAHISCYNGTCVNYDTGALSSGPLTGVLQGGQQ